ncbi:protein LATERAL ROOT PRIMORDIUM 1 isoform X2 [Argentina anserina]|uniref:protein LATERAL ROOT PRIMORDIUM 1 isoform X2 n=1 Tax=Argentina anserina TaxID=57926 RepID=UPI0021761E2F|nr:protein LATERAL ROOT PRIMORDIUM 1 isoform X2 [Potentilla anserina]
MLGLRDILLIAPNPSSMHQQTQPISSDHPTLPLPSSASLGVGLGIFPLLTATPCGPNAPAGEGNPDNSRFWSLRTYPDMNPSKQDMLSFGNHHAESQQVVESDDGNVNGDGGSGGGEESGLKPCKDCGNRAKKGCEYIRCRTCCRGRGYECSTHVRSTWVPAAKRRERQMGVTGGASSGGEGANLRQSLPDQVRAPAVFKCHRVTAISNGDAEIAYQATVKISGHVFKGLLYDRGIDKKNEYPCISHLHLGSGSNQRNVDSSSPPVHPSNVRMASTS